MNKLLNSYKNYKRELEIVKKIEGLLVPGQEKAFMVIASKLPENATVVEIGSFKGKSTTCIALASPKTTKIYAIDTFSGNSKDFSEGVQFTGGSFYEVFRQNLVKAGVWRKIIPQRGFSKEIGIKWNRPIDFLFIDGSHLYEDVKSDFELFYPWVKEGGIVAFHDVSQGHPGVLKYWRESARQKIKQSKNISTLYFGLKSSKHDQKKITKEIIDEATTKKVFFVLPVFNRLNYTTKCLNSLRQQTYKNIEAIVVDAGSKDGTLKYLRKNFPEVHIVEGDDTWYWTKSINAGIKRALENAEPEDFILTMNNDCYFNKNFIGSIVKCSQNNFRSITGSFIIDPEKSERVLDSGVIIDWKKAHIYGIPEKRPLITDYKNLGDHLSKIDTISGKGTLIPVEIFSRIGLFNSILLPHYLADYEFFNRAKTKGVNLIISLKSRLYNFSKQTGTEHGNFHHSAKYIEVIKVLFSRRSKINILDHLFFVLLRCPKKYYFVNLKFWLLKLISYLLLLFPFYYTKIVAHLLSKFKRKIRLAIRAQRIKARRDSFEK